MDEANIARCVKVLDTVKFEDQITPIWLMVEQRARILVRKGLGTNEIGAAEAAVKKAYAEALESVIESISGDLTVNCYSHLRANVNVVKEKIR